MDVQEGDQEDILTRADLPTPPEPNTTNLYSRMAGSLHWTAQQSVLDKNGGGMGQKTTNVKNQAKRQCSVQRIYIYLTQNKKLVCKLLQSRAERFESFLEIMDKKEHNRGNTHK